MNILLLSWRDPKNPRSGGAEYVTFEHAKGWVKKGDHVTWFATRFYGSESKEVLDGVKIIRYGNSFSVFFFAALYYFSHKRYID